MTQYDNILILDIEAETTPQRPRSHQKHRHHRNHVVCSTKGGSKTKNRLRRKRAATQKYRK